MRRAPHGLASTGNAVRGRSNAELFPRADQTTPFCPSPESDDAGRTEDGHDGRCVEHESSSVPRHEGRSKDPNAKHESGAVAITHAAPQQAATHDEGEQEGDRPKGSKQLGPVGRVGFSNRSENLGLGEVAAAREQNVPGVG